MQLFLLMNTSIIWTLFITDSSLTDVRCYIEGHLATGTGRQAMFGRVHVQLYVILCLQYLFFQQLEIFTLSTATCVHCPIFAHVVHNNTAIIGFRLFSLSIR